MYAIKIIDYKANEDFESDNDFCGLLDYHKLDDSHIGYPYAIFDIKEDAEHEMNKFQKKYPEERYEIVEVNIVEVIK